MASTVHTVDHLLPFLEYTLHINSRNYYDSSDDVEDEIEEEEVVLISVYHFYGIAFLS